MAHPVDVRAWLREAALRPSFSIMAVPHMIFYDCPSRCPAAEHMHMNWGEREKEREGFILYFISKYIYAFTQIGTF